MRNEETSCAVVGSNESETKFVGVAGVSDGGGAAALRPVRESHLCRVSCINLSARRKFPTWSFWIYGMSPG